MQAAPPEGPPEPPPHEARPPRARSESKSAPPGPDEKEKEKKRRAGTAQVALPPPHDICHPSVRLCVTWTHFLGLLRHDVYNNSTFDSAYLYMQHTRCLLKYAYGM